MSTLKLLKIHHWHKEYAWLSNNYLSPIWYGGDTYPSATHAFVASRTQDQALRNQVKIAKLSDLDKLVIMIGKTSNQWHGPTVMKEILEVKFGLYPASTPNEFAIPMTMFKKLVQTGTAQLVYGNLDHDMYWGQCLCNKDTCKNFLGKNLLGYILMAIRTKINERIRLSQTSDWCFCGAEAENAILYTRGWTAFLKMYCSNVECVKRTLDLMEEISSDSVYFRYPTGDSVSMPPLPESVPVNQILAPTKKVEILKSPDTEDDPEPLFGYNEWGVWMGPIKSTTVVVERKFQTLVIQGK